MDVVIRPFRKHINVVLQRIVNSYALHIAAAVESEMIVVGVSERNGEIIEMIELAFDGLAVRESQRNRNGGLGSLFGSCAKTSAASSTAGNNGVLKRLRFHSCADPGEISGDGVAGGESVSVVAQGNVGEGGLLVGEGPKRRGESDEDGSLSKKDEDG